jgi:pimeloyl-ACP methyl ester carboxylesterase
MNVVSLLSTLILLAFATLWSAPCMAVPVLQELSINIDGKQRRYYHLSDPAAVSLGRPILLVSGSGCGDFAIRLPAFFDRYQGAVNVYYLEKSGVGKGADGSSCSAEFQANDQFAERLSDHLKFINQEPELKRTPLRSIAVVGFSEGGAIAPYIARDSKKIGWLATVGSGGLRQSEEFLIFADRGVEPYAKPFSRAYFLGIYAEINSDRTSLQKEFFGHPYAYWSGYLFADPFSVYADLDIPIVAAMGEKDDSVPIESGRALRDYFLKHPEKDFQFVEFPGANHGLRSEGRNGLLEFIARLAPWFSGDKKAFELK